MPHSHKCCDITMNPCHPSKPFTQNSQACSAHFFGFLSPLLLWLSGAQAQVLCSNPVLPRTHPLDAVYLLTILFIIGTLTLHAIVFDHSN